LLTTTEQHDTYSLIRLEGDSTVTSAAELKNHLLEGLSSGKELRVDLERLEGIDVTLMQLLWAAGRKAESAGTQIVINAPEAATKAAQDAGFEGFPGELALTQE
jgi:anti-anti-sigma regulatory factor